MRNPGDTVVKDLDSSGTKDCWSGHPPWQEYGKEAMLKEYDPWIWDHWGIEIIANKSRAATLKLFWEHFVLLKIIECSQTFLLYMHETNI